MYCRPCAHAGLLVSQGAHRMAARCSIAHTAAARQIKYWYAPSAVQVQCPSTLATQDLEAEVFLHMMRMWTESKAAASQQEAEALMNAYAVAGDKQAPPRCDVQLLDVDSASVCNTCPVLLQVHDTARQEPGRLTALHMHTHICDTPHVCT
jgi:hypothetical protein